MKKCEQSKALIPIANGTWGTQKQLARFGIAQEDVIKLRVIMEGIAVINTLNIKNTKKKMPLLESPELNYFLALAGHFETHYIFDKGRITKKVVYLSADDSSPTSPHKNALPLRGLYHEYSDELKDIARDLIEFLSQDDCIESLRKCPLCENFFIAEDKKRKAKCYKASCSKEYERLKKERQREKEPEIYT